MLSRTADNLYWLSRYVERADNTARIIGTAQRLSALPVHYGRSTNEWESAVASTGALDIFYQHYDVANRTNVVEFLAFSEANPSSIWNCFAIARSNARAVRTALTIEMWEAINDAWHDLKRSIKMPRTDASLTDFLAWVERVSLAFDGSAYRTMLRNDAYWFSRLGVCLERADSTARILDVKYHVLLPPNEPIGGSLDYFQWSAILRSVSALTSYHWVYKESLKPWLVADLLILRKEMPRSLTNCYENVSMFLDRLSRDYGRQGPSQRMARETFARLQNTDIEVIFQDGLHEFVEDMIAQNNLLGATISEQYLK